MPLLSSGQELGVYVPEVSRETLAPTYVDLWLDPTEQLLFAQRKNGGIVDCWQLGGADQGIQPRQRWSQPITPVASRVAFSEVDDGVFAFIEASKSGGDMVLRSTADGVARGAVPLKRRAWCCCFGTASLRVAISTGTEVVVVDVVDEGAELVPGAPSGRADARHIDQLAFALDDAVLLACAHTETAYVIDTASMAVLHQLGDVNLASTLAALPGFMLRSASDRAVYACWKVQRDGRDRVELAQRPVDASHETLVTVAPTVLSPCGTFVVACRYSDGWPRAELHNLLAPCRTAVVRCVIARTDPVIALGARLLVYVPVNASNGGALVVATLPLAPTKELRRLLDPECLPPLWADDVGAFGTTGDLRLRAAS